jgi:hypothetical protein
VRLGARRAVTFWPQRLVNLTGINTIHSATSSPDEDTLIIRELSSGRDESWVQLFCGNDAIRGEEVGYQTPQIMERIGSRISYTANGE